METSKAIEVLKQLNEYRRDSNVPPKVEMPDPKEIGEAIDVAVEVLEVFGMVIDLRDEIMEA